MAQKVFHTHIYMKHDKANREKCKPTVKVGKDYVWELLVCF